MVGEHRGRRPFIACSLLAVPVLSSSMRLPLRGFAGRRWWGVGRWTGGWLAQPKLAATSRPGPSLAAPGAQERSRSGGSRGFLGPHSSPIPIVTRRCQTSHCGWLRDDDAPENRTLVPLCGADAIAGGRVNAVTIVDAGSFPFAPSKRRRSCAGCVWVGRILHCAAGQAWEIGQNRWPSLMPRKLSTGRTHNPATIRLRADSWQGIICCWRLETVAIPKEPGCQTAF